MPRPRLTESHRVQAEALGARLRTAREGLGLSREAVARRADLSTETLRKVETGKTWSPEFFTVARVASVVDVDLQVLAKQALRVEAPIAPRDGGGLAAGSEGSVVTRP